jgi:hypothetical protein
LINCKQIDIPKLKVREYDVKNLNNFFNKGTLLFDEKYSLPNWKSFDLVKSYKESPILSKFDSISVWKRKLDKIFNIENMYVSILLPRSSIPWHVDMQDINNFNKAILTSVNTKNSFIEFKNDVKYIYKTGYSYLIKSGVNHRILNLSDQNRIMICTNPKENKYV